MTTRVGAMEDAHETTKTKAKPKTSDSPTAAPTREPTDKNNEEKTKEREKNTKKEEVPQSSLSFRKIPKKEFTRELIRSEEDAKIWMLS